MNAIFYALSPADATAHNDPPQALRHFLEIIIRLAIVFQAVQPKHQRIKLQKCLSECADQVRV